MKANIVDDAGNVIAEIAFHEKDFKTGSHGFHGNGKAVINGDKYQCNFLLVKVHSKG